MSNPIPHEDDPERLARVESLFSEALDQPGDQRVAFVRSRTIDEGLAEDVLQRLAAHDELSSSTLPILPPPEFIGPYSLGRLLGAGGMGCVYLAEQSTPIQRSVAIKLVKPGMDTAQVLARFELERQALAGLAHDGIAKVFDAGALPDGRPYFVMEYVDGLPLDRFCAEYRLDVRARINLVRRVLRSVQHAHQSGIIHRDLKPANILVGASNGDAIPKIIDFGLARAVDGVGEDASRLTKESAWIGTPAYMAPEQRSNSSRADTRSDVYSMGAVLYQLLTGSVPHEHGESSTPGQHESAPRKPSSRITRADQSASELAASLGWTLPRLARAVRGDLDNIVLMALEADPKRRYATAAAFEDDLGRLLGRYPVAARPPSTRYQVYRWAERHRGAVAGLAAVIVTAVIGLVATTWQATNAMAALREKETIEEQNTSLRAQYAFDLAIASESLGDWSKAIAALEQARKLGYDATAIDLERLAISLASFDMAEFEQWLEVLDRPTCIKTPTQQARLDLLAGDMTRLDFISVVRQSRNRVRQALDSGALSPEDTHYARACLSESGTEALTQIEACLRVDSRHRQANEMRPMLHLLWRGPEAAITAIEEFERRYPNDHQMGFLLATAHQLAGNVSSAAELDLDPPLDVHRAQQSDALASLLKGNSREIARAIRDAERLMAGLEVHVLPQWQQVVVSTAPQALVAFSTLGRTVTWPVRVPPTVLQDLTTLAAQLARPSENTTSRVPGLASAPLMFRAAVAYKAQDWKRLASVLDTFDPVADLLDNSTNRHRLRILGAIGEAALDGRAIQESRFAKVAEAQRQLLADPDPETCRLQYLLASRANWLFGSANAAVAWFGCAPDDPEARDALTKVLSSAGHTDSK